MKLKYEAIASIVSTHRPFHTVPLSVSTDSMYGPHYKTSERKGTLSWYSLLYISFQGCHEIFAIKFHDFPWPYDKISWPLNWHTRWFDFDKLPRSSVNSWNFVCQIPLLFLDFLLQFQNSMTFPRPFPILVKIPWLFQKFLKISKFQDFSMTMETLVSQSQLWLQKYPRNPWRATLTLIQLCGVMRTRQRRKSSPYLHSTGCVKVFSICIICLLSCVM